MQTLHHELVAGSPGRGAGLDVAKVNSVRGEDVQVPAEAACLIRVLRREQQPGGFVGVATFLDVVATMHQFRLETKQLMNL